MQLKISTDCVVKKKFFAIKKIRLIFLLSFYEKSYEHTIPKELHIYRKKRSFRMFDSCGVVYKLAMSFGYKYVNPADSECRDT